MAASRQDAWNREEDRVLAEVVLRHIRQGSTQLAAFEEVGERLSRTAAACGFRWNSFVRKQHESAITLAKKNRKQMGQASHKTAYEEERTISLEDVIAYLEKFRSTEQHREKMIQENTTLKSQVSRLKEENTKLAEEIDHIKKENHAIREDYETLIAIMDRARERASDQEFGQTEHLQKIDE